MTGTPGRQLTDEEWASVESRSESVATAQANLAEVTADRDALWERLVKAGVSATDIASASQVTRSAVVLAVQRRIDRRASA